MFSAPNNIMLSKFLSFILIGFVIEGVALATPSPNPMDTIPLNFDFSIPSLVGNVKGSYRNLAFGSMIFDSGASPLEETAPGEVRRWVYTAAGGTIGIENTTYTATCIRATRVNVLSPQQEFYYEFRVSALEGGCTTKADDRLVEFTLIMNDFIVKKFNSGKSKFFGQSTDLYMFPILLRTPERLEAVAVDNGYFVGGKLSEVPFVANLRLELMLRPKGEMSCIKAKFDPDKDPYSSVSVTPDANGKWGATVPKVGGAVCMRLVGGGWKSAVSSVTLP